MRITTFDIYVCSMYINIMLSKALKLYCWSDSICDQISENGSKAHMKSIIFHDVFNCISTYAYVFPEYLLDNFDNLSIKFQVMV